MASFETDTIDNNMKLQVSRADHGQWMCLVNDNREFNSLKQFLNLNVGVTPDTGISVEAGEVFDADAETKVEVVEGDSIALSCYARRGYPPARIFWYYDISNETSIRVQETRYSSESGSHLVTVSRTIEYTASLLDHNNTLYCKISQADLTEEHLLYSRRMRVSLSVKERRFPAPLVREMTVISGVVVISTISFLFCLVFILLSVRFVRKRRRHNKRLSSLQDVPLVFRPAVGQEYSHGDVFSQIADHTKPLTHTCSTEFLDNKDNDDIHINNNSHR